MIKEFFRPKTIEEAQTLKEKFKGEALFLSGGTEINSLNFPDRARCLISCQDLGLNQIHLDENELTMGAGCTFTELIDHKDIKGPLKEAFLHINNRNIRNVATIGGGIASGKACSNSIPILVALSATIYTVDLGQSRRHEIVEYLALDKKDRPLIVKIGISKDNLQKKAAVSKYSRSANDSSIIAAALSLRIEHETIVDPVIAIGGIAKHVVRLEAIEDHIEGKRIHSLEDVEKRVKENVNPVSDFRGSVEFKKHVAAVMVDKTIKDAFHGKGRLL